MAYMDNASSNYEAKKAALQSQMDRAASRALAGVGPQQETGYMANAGENLAANKQALAAQQARVADRMAQQRQAMLESRRPAGGMEARNELAAQLAAFRDRTAEQQGRVAERMTPDQALATSMVNTKSRMVPDAELRAQMDEVAKRMVPSEELQRQMNRVALNTRLPQGYPTAPHTTLGYGVNAPAAPAAKDTPMLTPAEMGDKYYAGVTQALADAQKANDTPRFDNAQANNLMGYLGALSQAGLGPLLDKNFDTIAGYLSNDENNARMRDVANAQAATKNDQRWKFVENVMADAVKVGDPALLDATVTSLGYPAGTAPAIVFDLESKYANDPQGLFEATKEIFGTPVMSSQVEGRADGGEIGGTMNPTAVGASADLDTGDYVIPADVLRFYGSKFFTTLIEKADSD